MKLCVVTHRVVKGDGQGRANYEVIRAALQQGYSVTAVASQVADDLLLQPNFEWVNIPVAGWPTQLGKNLIFSCRSANWLRRHRHNYDTVKVNGSITSAPADLNAVHFVHRAWLRSPTHTSRLRPGPYGWYQWLYTALNAHWEKQALLKSRAVIAVSSSLKPDLLAIGIEPERIHVISNGVDLEEFKPGYCDRTLWNLPDGPLGLFVGDIQTPRKNLDTVLRALIKVPKLQIAIAGSLHNSPYPALAEKLGVASRVHFLDKQDNMPDLMRAADFLVFPSRYETFGLVILEAMATGIPVITAATTGAATLVTPQAGIVLEQPDDEAALTLALSQLSQDIDLRHAMGVAARTLAEQHSWAATAQSYLACVEVLVCKSCDSTYH